MFHIILNNFQSFNKFILILHKVPHISLSLSLIKFFCQWLSLLICFQPCSYPTIKCSHILPNLLSIYTPPYNLPQNIQSFFKYIISSTIDTKLIRMPTYLSLSIQAIIIFISIPLYISTQVYKPSCWSKSKFHPYHVQHPQHPKCLKFSEQPLRGSSISVGIEFAPKYEKSKCV